MKKKGFIDTLVKAGIAAAAIGGTLYLLKDKFEEDPKYKEAVDKVKDKIKSYMPEKEAPIDEDDFFDEDFDEDFDEVIQTSSSERGYVNIKLPTEDDFEEAVEKVEEAIEQAADKVEDAVDTFVE